MELMSWWMFFFGRGGVLAENDWSFFQHKESDVITKVGIEEG